MVIQPPFQSDPSYKVNSNMYFWFHHLPRPISLTWCAEENSPVNCLMAAFWPRTQSMTALAGAVSQHAALDAESSEPRVHAQHMAISEWWTHHTCSSQLRLDTFCAQTLSFSCLPQFDEAQATTTIILTSSSWAAGETMLLSVPGPSCCFPPGAGVQDSLCLT